MKTTVEYVDGQVFVAEGELPVFIEPDEPGGEWKFSVMDQNCASGDDVPCSLIKRVVWEP